MPDIEFTVEDAIARLGSERDDAVERVEREYQRLVADLRQVQVAREKLNDSLLQLNAAAVAVSRFDTIGRHLSGFCLRDNAHTQSEWCNLIRPLKPGRYKCIVIFTEDEEKTETPR